ncbi:MAG: hypothetical protein V3S55_14785 [Nitrospiraceae bacterium]
MSTRNNWLAKARKTNALAERREVREPRLEKFPAGGASNKLKVRLGIRNLAALPVLAKTRASAMGPSLSALRP